jgi:Arc/MetJ-type ribon-helix-helix transcriptional regulator
VTRALAVGNASGYTSCMTQIAVKLPDALVRELDDLVAQGVFPNRSSAVRRAVEAIVARQRRDVLERAFAEGYHRLPESSSELAEARRLAEQAINDEPWDKWW